MFLRVIAGAVATLLILRASFTALTVLRRFDLIRATEGQLALERRVELAATFVRVGAGAQIVALVFSALAADKLSHSIRGAMCAYGTFSSSPWGFRAFGVTVVSAVAAGTVVQLFEVDAQARGMELTRVLAWATLVLAPLCALDLVLQLLFVFDLDLSVVASCCSVQLDPVAAARQSTLEGPRVVLVVLALVMAAMCVTLALMSARRPRRPQVAVIGAAALLALPLGVAAVVLEVAPYVFETPQHHCPFCLLHGDVAGIGYLLFGSMFAGAVSLFGAGLSAAFAKAPTLQATWSSFAASRLRRGALAWGVCVVLSIVPVAHYAVVSHGAALFP